MSILFEGCQKSVYHSKSQHCGEQYIMVMGLVH